MRIAINGMGRIGRLLLRRLVQLPEFSVVAVNDLMPPPNLGYLLNYDSVYGVAPSPFRFSDGALQIGEESIPVFSQPHPEQLPWGDLKPDVVLECTGAFTKKALAQLHLQAGAKKILLSTTGATDIPLFIWGVNQNNKSWESDIISPGGCMTNCVASVIHALAPFGIESLQLNVVHSYTSRQELVDAPHKDFRRGRAAAESIIPVPVDLAESLERLFPFLSEKLATLTTRVPVANGAVADLCFLMPGQVTKDEVNDCLRKAAEGSLKGVLQYTEEPLVSLDVKGNTHSAVIDGTLTSLAGRQVKVVALFDNEYGYTSRIIDWLMLCKNGAAVI
jgi:glyceraldehyde 3-phosphate dehydrogenase